MEVLTTRASQGSLPWRMAPAKLSGCTSSPTIRSALLLLIFLASFLLCFPLLHGRRGRAPDEYLKRRHPGLHRSYALHLHEGSFRQDSLSLQSGSYWPQCIARVPAGIALPLLGSVVCQSHRKSIESSGLASRPAQLHPFLNPYRQPTAGRRNVYTDHMTTDHGLQFTLALTSGG